MAHVDLDAARAARDEARGDVSVTLGGREYKLRRECSIDAGEAWRANNARGFLALVLADDTEVDDFMANEPSWVDLNGIFDAYSLTAGESSASSTSSTIGGKTSRPTSSERTASA